jgi:putative DNA primase/helicase
MPMPGARFPNRDQRDIGGRVGTRGLIVKCFGGCRPRDVLAELRRRRLIDGDAGGIDARPDPAEIKRRQNAETRERQQRIALARDMVAESLSAGGTVVERYLREVRKVLGTHPVPPSIRYLPMASSYAWHPPSGGRRPVMLAVVEHVERSIVGVHRTWLALDGSAKASLDPVRMSAGLIRGGAVRLAPAGQLLMVAEGIETALAAMRACALPAWAALSTSGLRTLELPDDVRDVIVLADGDEPGEAAARACGGRWKREGRRVRIARPPQGLDFNDLLMGCAPRIDERGP